MNRIFAWVFLNCLIATNCAFVHAARLHEDLLPENTWLTVSVADVSKLSEAYDKGPLPVLFEQKGMDSVMEKLQESSIGKQFSDLTVSGELLTWQAFINNFPGRITFACISNTHACKTAHSAPTHKFQPEVYFGH